MSNWDASITQNQLIKNQLLSRKITRIPNEDIKDNIRYPQLGDLVVRSQIWRYPGIYIGVVENIQHNERFKGGGWVRILWSSTVPRDYGHFGYSVLFFVRCVDELKVYREGIKLL